MARKPPIGVKPVACSTRHDGWTRERRTLFLEALARGGVVTAAAAAAGKQPQSAYALRTYDAAFAAAWELAKRQYHDSVQAVLTDRAINGVDRIVFHNGKPIGTQREYSDRLLIHAATTTRPADAPLDRHDAAERAAQAERDAAYLVARIDALFDADGERRDE